MLCHLDSINARIAAVDHELEPPPRPAPGAPAVKVLCVPWDSPRESLT